MLEIQTLNRYIAIFILLLNNKYCRPELIEERSWNLPSECGSRQYFNPITLKCTDCGDEKSALVANHAKNDCECKYGYVDIKNQEQQKQNINSNALSPQQIERCVRCMDYGLVMDYHNQYCVKCASNEEKSMKDKCLACNEDEITILDDLPQKKSDRTKNYLNEKVERCLKCPNGMISDKEKKFCIPCMETECFCKTNSKSSYCSKNRNSDADSVIYSDNFNEQRVNIDYLSKKTVVAAAKCQQGNRRECQHLINLCVLTDFNRNTISSACDYLENIRRNVYNAQSFLPNLFYSNTEAAIELYRVNAIEGTFNLHDGNMKKPKINYKLDLMCAVYALNGSFLDFFKVTGNLLNLCFQNSNNDIFQFGKFFRQECDVNIRQSLRWNNGMLLKKLNPSDDQTIFFEIFLRYVNDNNEQKLYQIPIINENIRDSSMRLINRAFDDVRRNQQAIMVRRFFIVDYQFIRSAMETSKFLLRIPEQISLIIQLQNSKDSKIFPPYIQIRYRSYIYDLENETNQYNGILDKNFHRNVFNIEYKMENILYDKFIEVTLASLCSFSFLLALMNAYSWARRSGRLMIDGATIFKFVLYMCQNISNVFFIVMSLTAMWITYTFKLQNYIILFPLTHEQEASFIVYIIIATALSGVVLLHKYVAMAFIETFFIDWERPRFIMEQRQNTTMFEVGCTKEKLSREYNSIVIWRTYLVANKWNELQSYRKTSITIQFFTLLFILEYLNFGNWAIMQPGLERDNLQYGSIETRMSRFSIDIFFYWLIGFTQWIIQILLIEKIIDPFRNFMDLCSIANISVLIMTHSLYGFYIHGRSVHGLADTDMFEMNTFLLREKENLCGLRGLENGSEIQTFRVRMPRQFRNRLNQFVQLSREDENNVNLQQRGMDKITARIGNTAKIHSQLNMFLKDIIDHVDANCDYTIVDGRFIEEMIGIELTDTTKNGNFIRDLSETGYTSALLYGNEWAQMSFEALMFCLLDIMTHSRIFSAIITYFTSTIIKKIASHFFTINLMKSSMIDNRFLI